MNYATRVVAEPIAAPGELVRLYNSAPGNWIYPVPLRIGHYYLIAGIMKVFGASAEQAGVALSTSCSIVQLVMVALFGLRFFDRWTALTAVALLSVSPHDLAMARRVWGDGVSGCLAMVFFWLCAEIAVRPRARLLFLPLGICAALFLLIKETGGFFFGFCILGLLIQSKRQNQHWTRAAWIVAGAGAAAVCSFAIMAWLCGGVPAAFETIRHNGESTPGNAYAVLYQNGPWYSFPLGLWILSPLTAFGCVVGLIALILPGDSLGRVLQLTETQRTMTWGLAGIILIVIVAATLPPDLKNLRYISFIVGPWHLMAAVGLSYTLERIRNSLGSHAAVPVIGLAIVLVFFSCWADYSRFRDIFVQRAVVDLDIRHMVTSPVSLSF